MAHQFLHTIRIGVVSFCLLGLAGCTEMTSTQQSTLSGGAIGAGVGVVSTVITGGCIPCGTAIGGAVGAGTGYVIDKVSK